MEMVMHVPFSSINEQTFEKLRTLGVPIIVDGKSIDYLIFDYATFFHFMQQRPRSFYIEFPSRFTIVSEWQQYESSKIQCFCVYTFHFIYRVETNVDIIQYYEECPLQERYRWEW